MYRAHLRIWMAVLRLAASTIALIWLVASTYVTFPPEGQTQGLFIASSYRLELKY